MPKLTKQLIESEIQFVESGQRFYRDDELRGFAVRVTRTSKSYVVEKRIDGINRRITIGKCSDVSLESARKQASTILGNVARGHNPVTGKPVNPNDSITLREVLQKFLAIKPIRKSTQRNYIFAINRHFQDWLDSQSQP